LTGKTTLINYLLGRNYPGMQVGPEPTTDRFVVLMHNKDESIIPGNVFVSDPKHQFCPLRKFGNTFLKRLQCSEFNSSLLETITIVDTPGILSGETKSIDRGYDINGVFESLSEVSDRVILLFDPHKLDISDEFKMIIGALCGNEDKIRVVLNKADMIDQQQLIRAYGALMWSLGRIFKKPEVVRVYIGSFWNQSTPYESNRKLFDAEEQDLFDDIISMPRNAVLRKLDYLIRRSQSAKIHAYLISELYNEKPYFFTDENKLALIERLSIIYKKIEKIYGFPSDDFPNLKQIQEKLKRLDFSKFKSLNHDLIDSIDKMRTHDIPRLLSIIQEEQQAKQDTTHTEL
jgi:GTPase Era involved in 16S rRNA processing